MIEKHKKNELRVKYENQFDEAVAFLILPSNISSDLDEMIKLLTECLENGKPIDYDLYTPKGVDI